MHSVSLATAAAFLAALPAAHAGMYPKNSPVLQVTAKTYDQLINKSNHTSIVEFYAPWCGHCQNLKPAYEKAARNLEGLAQVAAIDCDDDANKQLCGSLGVKGFPTLKIVRPAKKTAGRPIVDDYNGARTASGIADAVLAQVNNHVTKVTDKDAAAFLAANDGPKALLFTDKGTISPLLKSIAIDFLGVISVGQVRSKESQTVADFYVRVFPTLVLLPAGSKDKEGAVVFGGELNKDAIVQFLSQAGAPNTQPAPSSDKPAKKDKEPKKEKKEKKEKKDKASKKAEDPETESETKSEAETETTAGTATQQTTPVIVETAVPIPSIHTPEKLVKECLHAKAHTCVLAFVPSTTEGHKGQAALDNLSELAHKYAQGRRHLFPFYAVPDTNAAAPAFLQALGIDPSDGQTHVIAINARRNWWRHYGEGESDLEFSHEGIESWIDAIRMSEGVKKKLPESLVAAISGDFPSEAKVEETPVEETPAATASSEAPEAASSESASSESAAEEEATEAPKAEEPEEIKHEEL